DSVASAVAVAVGAKKLILLTDVPGVLGKKGELISSMTLHQAVHALEQGVVTGGMIPKIKCCMEAVDGGVSKAHILDGRVENVILLEMFTQGGIGSEITSK
ncbi:MAG: acetylglutamate kinase, partial [Deltaproteobacteria bacterium HGW-Deltaproteobacteria-20]